MGALVSAFESETAAVILHTAPRNERTILYTIAGMIALTLVLMSVTKLDRVVTSTGRIEPIEGSFYVQPYDKAIVRDIRVKVGDIVRKGQVLATLDPTFAAADLTALEQKAASDAALIARLHAERDGKSYFGGIGPYAALQEAIWQKRQAEYRSGLADFDARIRADEAVLQKAQGDVAVLSKRLKIATDIVAMRTTLEQHGNGSRLGTMTAVDTQLDMNQLLQESRGQIAQSQHDADSLKAQRTVFVEHWLDDVNTQLVAAGNDLDLTNQELTKAQKVHQLVNLVSPRDAVVLKIGKASVGSVTSPAPSDAPSSEPLFTLVPIDGPLEADIDIPADEIGFIKPGQVVDIKLNAYDFLRHGMAKGVVKTISDGSFTLDENQQPSAPYFKARVEITDVHLHDVPANFRLMPGMTVAGDIKVGHRTLMSYLINGALRTGSEAMREP